MRFIAHVEGDVSHHVLCGGRRQVDGAEVGPFFRERRSDHCKHPWLIGQFKPNCQAIV